jgi:hydroxymethylbilane synthase
MERVIRIGTRESQLAVWQAAQVQALLARQGTEAELVYIKSEGDIDLKTPLYEMGVQGIFTRSLDIALLHNRIDVAVHSMKDVPTQLPPGIRQAAVLPRGPVNDLLVFKTNGRFLEIENYRASIATSSIRRKAQWLHKYPGHELHNLRGNVNTRLKKLSVESWDAAIFAQAGLERINLRPQNSVVIDWMLPAPAQGAIVAVCRHEDEQVYNACRHFHDTATATCTKAERDFLRALSGGCSTPISALAEIKNGELHFRGSILSLDGKEKADIEKRVPAGNTADLGRIAAEELLLNGGQKIADAIRHAG